MDELRQSSTANKRFSDTSDCLKNKWGRTMAVASVVHGRVSCGLCGDDGRRGCNDETIYRNRACGTDRSHRGAASGELLKHRRQGTPTFD